MTPSLGKFSVGTVVNIKKALNDTLLSTGTITSNGSVTLSLAGYTGPIVVEVLGGVGVTYFDEKLVAGKGTWQPFVGTLRAVVPTTTGLAEVGVTALTNAAAEAIKDPVNGFKNVTDKFGDANAKIAAVYGLSDILIAPVPVDDKTVTKLLLGNKGDNYALILAALAKTAPAGKFAADVAIALAADLKDGVNDGLANGVGSLIDGAPLKPAMIAQYKAAADDWADESAKSSVNLITYLGKENVTTTVGPVTASGVALAKAMFAELRTTLNSFANGSKTGFLDTQATSMNADLTANVAPEMNKVAGRISALSTAVGVYEDASANNATQNFATGTSPTGTPTSTLVRQRGTIAGLWYGYNTTFDYCWTDSATGVTSKVSCAHADSSTIDRANNRIKMVVFELTKTAANQYSYTATRYNTASVNPNMLATNSGLSVFTLQPSPVINDSANNPVPAGSGTFAKTFSGTNLTGFAINGTLPPSASTTVTTSLCSSGMGPTCTLTSSTSLVTSGVDNIAVSVARTALTANTYNHALTGSVSTTKLGDTTKVVTLSLDSGSYFNTDETPATVTGVSTSPKLIAAKFVGTAQTAATKFTGSLDVGAFATSKNKEFSPTSIVFNGSINDIRPSVGTGQILTGKLEATVADYANFDSSLAESATNYLHATMTFTGTVQAPNRPLLKLVVAAVKTGVTTGDVTLNYSYGTNISITGSGKVNTVNPASNTLTLSNQDGIELVITNNAATQVKKSGTSLATITNGSISYIDGVTESLN